MSAKLKWNVHPRLQIELDATSIKDAFEQMSAYSVLAETKCGLCESVRVYPRHRVSKGFSFYEMSCPDCKAVFSFGQHKDMDTLFPKEREAGIGSYLAMERAVRLRQIARTEAEVMRMYSERPI